jgi:hypothetical protein
MDRVRRYDPTLACVSDSTLSAFLGYDLDDNLMSVPSIGPANSVYLNMAGVFTTYQLIGKFLSFKDRINRQEHLDKFYQWLLEIKCSARAHCIVYVISKKCELLFPDMYIA